MMLAMPHPSIAQGKCGPKDKHTITLTKTAPTLGVQIHPGCWMPQVDTNSKVQARLCGHGPKKKHTFELTLDNACDDVAVRLTVTIRSGGRIRFESPACRSGPGGPAYVFDGFVDAGKKEKVRCETSVHADDIRLVSHYDVMATQTRVGTQVIEIPDVDYDPEIVLEKSGRFHAGLVALAALLAAVAAAYWYRWRRRRAQQGP